VTNWRRGVASDGPAAPSNLPIYVDPCRAQGTRHISFIDLLAESQNIRQRLLSSNLDKMKLSHAIAVVASGYFYVPSVVAQSSSEIGVSRPHLTETPSRREDQIANVSHQLSGTVLQCRPEGMLPHLQQPMGELQA